MSVFSDILKAIGLGGHDQPATGVKPQAGAGATKKDPNSWAQPDLSRFVKTDKTPMRDVDVAKKLDGMVKASGQKLDWRMSIVDLMKVLGIDSSHANRVELATELGAPKEVMGGDSAAMNIWLHKQVMTKIASNGGIVPKELMD